MAKEELAVELRVRNQQLANDLKKSTAQVNAFKKSMVEMGNSGAASFKKIETSSAKTAKSLSTMANVLRAVAVYSAGQAILGNLKTWSDYISNIQAANNQLKSLGGTLEEQARLQAIALQVANDTGSAYEETAVTIARLSRALEEFGGTTDQAAIITDSLNKALLLTGATGSEATSTLVQFSQALQSGILQGDELRSLRENAPAVIRAIADEMGIATSQIKKAGEDGKITVDVISKALIKANADLTAQTEQIPLTLGRSLTVASNNIKDFISNSETLTKFIEQLAEALFYASNLLLIMAEDMTTYNGEANAAAGSTEGLVNIMDILAVVIGGPIKAFYTLGKAMKLVIDIAINTVEAIWAAFVSLAKRLYQLLSGIGTSIEGAFSLDADKLKAGLSNISGALLGFAGDWQAAGQVFLDRSAQDLTEFATGVKDVWLNTAREVKKINLNPDGDIKAPPAEGKDGAAKKVKEDTSAIDAYTAALKALQQQQLSMSSASVQARAEFEGVNTAIAEFRVLAAAAGKTVDEEFIAVLEELALQRVEKKLEDLQVAWVDLSTALSENGLRLQEQQKLWEQFVVTGIAAGKSMDEIAAAYKKFQDDTKNNEGLKQLSELTTDVGDAFNDAAMSIIFDSESVGDAMKNLAKEVGKLILQFLILKAVQSLTGVGGGSTGGVPGGIVGPQGFPGPQVRVFNYGTAPGGVQVRQGANGQTDIIIGQVARAIGQGGNALDSALRRTYGIGRVGA